jgi:hypothetical protein
MMQSTHFARRKCATGQAGYSFVSGDITNGPGALACELRTKWQNNGTLPTNAASTDVFANDDPSKFDEHPHAEISCQSLYTSSQTAVGDFRKWFFAGELSASTRQSGRNLLNKKASSRCRSTGQANKGSTRVRVWSSSACCSENSNSGSGWRGGAAMSTLPKSKSSRPCWRWRAKDAESAFRRRLGSPRPLSNPCKSPAMTTAR